MRVDFYFKVWKKVIHNNILNYNIITYKKNHPNSKL